MVEAAGADVGLYSRDEEYRRLGVLRRVRSREDSGTRGHDGQWRHCRERGAPLEPPQPG